MELPFLCGAAFLAGFVDAVAGGGGLIQLPALLLVLPQQTIPMLFGTNKMSSICGTAVATVQYARQVPIRWRSILPAAFAAFAFSGIGAWAIRSFSTAKPEILKPLILGLLIAVALHTAFKKELGKVHQPRMEAGRERLVGLLLGAVIGFYDGFFGPGTGSFLIIAFVGWFGFDFLNATASAKVLNLATNLAAVLYFSATGNILWEFALPMGVCNIAGSLIGTRLTILKGNRFVRAIFLAVIALLIARFGWELWRGR